MLQAGAQRAQRARVRGGAQPQSAPGPLDQGGGDRLPVEQLDVQVGAVPVLADQVAVRAVRGDGHRLQAGLAQAVQQLAGPGPGVRGADGPAGAVGGRPADQHTEQQRGRGGRPGGDPGQRGQGEDGPRHPAFAGRGGGEEGQDGRQVAVDRLGVGERGAGQRPGQCGDQGERRGVVDPQREEQGDPVRQDGGQHAVGELLEDVPPVGPGGQQPAGGRAAGQEQQGGGGEAGGDAAQRVRDQGGGAADVLGEAVGGGAGVVGGQQGQGDHDEAREQPDQRGRLADPAGGGYARGAGRGRRAGRRAVRRDARCVARCAVRSVAPRAVVRAVDRAAGPAACRVPRRIPHGRHAPTSPRQRVSGRGAGPPSLPCVP